VKINFLLATTRFTTSRNLRIAKQLVLHVNFTMATVGGGVGGGGGGGGVGLKLTLLFFILSRHVLLNIFDRNTICSGLRRRTSPRTKFEGLHARTQIIAGD